MGCRDGGLPRPLRSDRSTAGCGRHRVLRDLGRGHRVARVPRCVRSRDRQARLALLDDSCAGRARIRDVGRSRDPREGLRSDMAHRQLRPATRPTLLGNRESLPRPQRGSQAGRQPLYELRSRAAAANRRTSLAFPVHASRHSRLGRARAFAAGGRGVPGRAAQAASAGQPQRFLLRAGSGHGRIPAGRGLHRADVGRGHRARWKADCETGQRPHVGGQRGVPGNPGRNQLVGFGIQSRNQALLPDGSRVLHGLHQGRQAVGAREVVAGRNVPID